MTFNFKKALLAGSAIVAVGSIGAQAHAADLTLSGAAVWGTAANGMVATPTAGDNVIMTANNLGFDTTETGVLTAGALTSTTGALTVDTTGDLGNVAFTIGSFTGSGAANVTVDNLNASSNRNVALNVTGVLSTGGALVVRNTEVGGSNTSVVTTVGGNTTVTGTTTIATTGTGQTGTVATLDLNGATNTFTGAVTVTGGANSATNDASLLISGASTTFTGGLVLNNGAAGQAVFTLDGTAAQSVTGAISGNGEINVTNNGTGAVTFNTDSTHTGTLTVNNDATNQTVSILGNSASAIALGNNVGAHTITANFGRSTAQAVSGGITGGASENVVVNFIGGNTVTLSGAATSGVDTTTITGNTTVATNQNYGSTNISIASGSTLSTTANTVTGAIANSGTLALNGGSVVGAVTGTGLLDVNVGGAINGAITQGTADIAAVTLTQTTASGYNVGSTNFSGAGTLALAGGAQTVAGNFTNTTDGQGTITIADSATTTAFTGNLGASTAHSLLALTVAGAGANLVTTTGNVFVDTTTLNANDTLQFLGTSAQTVSGAVNGGILTVGNGTTTSDVSFNGLVNAASSTVSAAAKARYTAAGTSAYTGTYTNTGTTYVSQGSVLSADTLTDTGSYVLNVVDANGTLAAADFGSLTDTGGGAATLTASRLAVNVTGDLGVGTVQLLTHVQAGAATLTDNSIQYSFVTANNGNNTDVTVARTTAATLAVGSNNTGIAPVIDSLNASTNTQIAAIVDNLAAAPTQAAFNEVLEAAGPTVDGGAVVGGFNASVQSMGVSNDRLASLRTGNETGMVAGEMGNGLATWIQGFGQTADQDRRDGVDGYQADTYGIAVGLDTDQALENGTVGVSLSYANTNVDSDNANRTEADVDSYQVSVYGDYDVAPQTYILGNLGYAWNNIDQTRHNVGGVVGLTANGDYDSEQFIAYTEVGHDFAVADRTTLTPHVSAHYQHISIDDYLETGAGGANLNVKNDDLDIFELGVGAELAWDLDGGNGSKIRPALNVGYRHDLVGDNVQSTSNFTGGGAAFKTDGLEPARGTFDVGASIGYAMDNNWEFTADYDFEAKSDYTAHSGFVRAGYKF